MSPWHLYLMASMYIAIGLMHFIKPKAFLYVMPRYIPAGMTMVYLSGLAEIVLGAMLCFPETRNIAIIGIILLLSVFLTVHYDMLVNKKYREKFPLWILWLRFFLQFGLMYWAYFYII